MGTTGTKLQDTILHAIDIVASQKIAKAGYDKTIQATVVSCIDSTIGKYKVKYQDSYWIAYSDNANNYYAPNTNVYILIPGGDMSKDKTIIGSTKRLGTNYITVAEGDERYAPIGSNVILDNITHGLCSYRTSTIDLYNLDTSNYGIGLSVDNQAVNQYITNSTSIIVGAYIRNNLKPQQRFQGNYGIRFGLNFLDPFSNRIKTRYFDMDVNSMSGNPYYYPNEVRQYNIFEIDGANFRGIKSISLFVKDFPNQNNNITDNDIFISRIELGGVVAIEEEDLNSCALVLTTPKGYIFTADSINTDTRSFKAQLRVKGKIIDIKSQKVDFYWFIENVSITAASPKYSKYGGLGWECLNGYRTIQAATSTTPAVLQFIPSGETFSVKKSDIYAETTKYKCVAIYDNMTLSKQFKIIRKDAQYKISISSSSGTDFYNSAGDTTLTCQCYIRGSSGFSPMANTNLNYVWSSIDSAGTTNLLLTTEQFNEDVKKLQLLYNTIDGYINAEYLFNQQSFNAYALYPSDSSINSIQDTTQKTKVTNLKNALINGGLANATAAIILLNKYNINNSSSTTYRLVLDGDENNTVFLKSAMNSYNNIQRIAENVIYNVKVNNIVNYIVYKCSVFTKTGNLFLGSNSITLTNSNNKNNYSLVINNGVQVFKYNTHGVSPASKQNKNPQVIPALTFNIYDGLGNVLEDDAIATARIKWIIPNKNTLLKPATGASYDNTLEFITFQNYKSFAYTIAENYNVDYHVNDIELQVEYNGILLTAKTNLSFLKQGQNGTNGTDFVCKIIPNVISGKVPLNPIIYYYNGTVSFNWNNDTVNNKWFKAQLWHNGNQPIFEGTESAQSTEGKLVTVVQWEVLKNIYSNTKSDSTNLTITKATSSGSWSFGFSNITFSSSYSASTYSTWRPANIIKVTLSYDGMIYYATLPVITCRLFSSMYKFELKDYSGFRQVLYSSSGQQPTYDAHAPFEILTYYSVGSTYQDISTRTTSDFKLKYEWYYLGSTWFRNNNSNNWVENVETTQSTAQSGDSSTKKWLLLSKVTPPVTQSNQKAIKPADEYNGECVNAALGCRIALNKNDTTIGWMHIPIHMMRNRFENSAINGWDGNSVNLGGDNGGMILAPQVGAGTKDTNNRFTGIVMGIAKDPQQQIPGLGSTGTTSNPSSNEDVGLFGYHEGSRTIFLDAKTGKAVFGEKQQAQIILDPTDKGGAGGRARAQIYSGNYADTGSNKAGLKIDLTTPSIKFGTGNFSVNANGHITAKGGGQIAGWEINDTAIFNKKVGSTARNSTGMNSNPTIDADSTSINNTTGSEYRQIRTAPTTSEQAAVGYKDTGGAAAFWAGGSNFFVTHEGYLSVQQASIGSGSKPIFIGKTTVSGKNDSAIFSGWKHSLGSDRNGFYLGTDGFAMGTSQQIVTGIDQSTGNNITETVSNFQVNPDGTFFARKGYIGNGKAGWQIGNNHISNGKSNLNDTTKEAGVYIGTNGIALGRYSFKNSSNEDVYATAFKVTNEGNLTAKKGIIGNWTINNNSISYNVLGDYYYNPNYDDGRVATQGIYFGKDGLRMGSRFHVDSAGNLYASSGEFHGKVTATEGSFSGTVYATDGEFTGTIHATDGEFTGTIHATDGIIDSNVTINGKLNVGNLIMGNVSVTNGNGPSQQHAVSWRHQPVIYDLEVKKSDFKYIEDINSSTGQFTRVTAKRITGIKYYTAELIILEGSPVNSQSIEDNTGGNIEEYDGTIYL